ncbi:MAG: class I SAM-dependent methyltransferase [Anaerolineae bacterium]|nr:class I SAM-dependent methyltransferase [Anaerolineae bacterium]
MAEIPERLVPGSVQWAVYEYEHRQRYEFFAGESRDLQILDAACGVGYGSKILADAGAQRVVGVDISAEAIEYAKGHYQSSNLEFLQGDVTGLDIAQDTFDKVISFETVEHVRIPEEFFQEVHRVLKPGGEFICSTPNSEFSGGGKQQENPYHLSEMTYAAFESAFSAYFELEKRYFQTHSDAYRRYLGLLRETENLHKVMRFSKLLAAENFLRRVLGRPTWKIDAIPPELARAVPGDFEIGKLETPLDTHLTFIFVGRKKE